MMNWFIYQYIREQYFVLAVNYIISSRLLNFEHNCAEKQTKYYFYYFLNFRFTIKGAKEDSIIIFIYLSNGDIIFNWFGYFV